MSFKIPVFSSTNLIGNSTMVSMCKVGHIFTGIPEMQHCIVCMEIYNQARKDKSRKIVEIWEKISKLKVELEVLERD